LFFVFHGCQYFFGILWPVPKIGTKGYGLFCVQFVKLLVDVKDASSEKLFYLLNPAVVL